VVPKLTPYFLSKPFFWFNNNHLQLKNLAKKPWAKNQVLVLEKDQAINLFNLLKQLTDLGYQKVQQTLSIGQFSHRGNLIDIFALGNQNPWRLEFLGNKIEQITILKNRQLEQDGLDQLFNYKSLKNKTPLSETIKPGDYLVHLDHGIGKFIGFANSQSVPHNPQTYFIIEYAQNDKLYVPINLSDKLNLYFGFNRPTVHRLGGNLWAKTKKRVSHETIELARELIKIYAARETSSGFVYEPDSPQTQELIDDFPYPMTNDQEQAIAEVNLDMESADKMDRLICGDVGFGKTEVALRAAFKAIMSGRQVALLAPTTILVNQHFNNFRDRMERFGINVAMLSRLQTDKDQQKIVGQINQGLIDIAIGTHRLISKDVHFKNLGLAIIDEEQRFGVRQKEKFKKIRANMDILSLSATPIPRTLYLAISSLRDVSLIQTPPAGRLPIKTHILEYQSAIIKSVILKEFDRQGQAYFLHNRVQTIDLVKQKLQQLIGPRAKIGVVHGRLAEKELIKVMNQFRARKINLLLATTIIENGIDLPDANTLIVEDATRLGLAQAYQIRGRIGRSNIQAHAYFLYRTKSLTDIAQKRLTALKQAETLGSGYEIAKRDLEIRGAGNILGRQQSGHINAVGLNLYCQMLNEAVRQLKNA